MHRGVIGQCGAGDSGRVGGVECGLPCGHRRRRGEVYTQARAEHGGETQGVGWRAAKKTPMRTTMSSR
ncbi:hypothetical protein ABTA52_20145 [Acinetobacter baumannii]